MTNLSRLTLAAALLGGMAAPAFAQTAAAPAVPAKLHSHVNRVAATEAAPTKDAAAKDAMLPKAASKDTMTEMSKDAPKTAGSTAMAPSPSAAMVKPVAPGQTVQAPTTAPKVN